MFLSHALSAVIKKTPWIMTLSLLGCTSELLEADFQDELMSAECQRMEECGWLLALGDKLEDCLNVEETLYCADYDPVAASDCVSTILEGTCQELESGVIYEACELACPRQ